MEDDHPIIGLIEGRALPDGRTNWTITSKLPLHDADGEVIGLYGVTREINEIRQTEAALQHLATHDSLTDLPNRFLLTDRMNQLLVRSSRRPVSFAILFMDIDRFKVVNDTFGHETGDQLLRVVADRLRLAVRTSDTVARLGGDEFVVLIETPAAEAAAERVARKIEAAFVLPFTLARQRIKVGISIGISLHPQSGDSADALMHAADRAMYMAKREGGNRHRTCLPEEPCSNADFVEASA
jgi:diguanylate cyclase (GGDEF)-like protein